MQREWRGQVVFATEFPARVRKCCACACSCTDLLSADWRRIYTARRKLESAGWFSYGFMAIRPPVRPLSMLVEFGDRCGAKQRSWKETIDRLERGRARVDVATYAHLLRRCGDAKSLVDGRRLRSHLVKSGYGRDRYLGNLVMEMYGKCGALQDAREVFANIHQRNVYSWTIMIKVYTQHGQGRDALLLFRQMQMVGVVPNKVTLLSILSACTSRVALAEGKALHACIVRSGFELDFVVGNALVNMYCKCGSLGDARVMLARMNDRNVLSWTALIAAYVHNGHRKEALLLFYQMQLEGVVPDKVAFLSVLSACASHSEGKLMHADIVDCGFGSDVTVATALVNMYCKCSSLEDARRVFDKIPSRDSILWTAMIAACAQHGHGREAIRLFQQMQLEDVVPDKVTFVSILSACASFAGWGEGRVMHSCILARGFELDVTVGTALINMYWKCGSLEDAWRIFDKMPERNVVSWSVMIAACVQHGFCNDAFQLFQQMQMEGVLPDTVTFVSVLSACAIQDALTQGRQMHARIVADGFETDVAVGTALVNMYGKCGSLEDAWRTFENMGQRDVVSWNAMIAAFVQHGQGKCALRLFQQMQMEDLIPNKVTFISILSACANQAVLAEGKWMHAQIMSSGFESDVVVGNAIVNMYSNCDSLVDALRMFDKMPERDVVSWNVMIAAYVQHWRGKEAFQLFEKMQLEDVIPDKVTYISILSLCASQGVLAEGKHMHAFIVDSGIESDVTVANALVNMYGKCGSLEDAWWVFKKMPEWNSVSWTVMITAYAEHGHGTEVLQLFHQMNMEGMVPDKVTFISILSACSHTGLVDEGRCYFVSMSQDYGITPSMEHYNCMVNLLGRAGRLEEAEDLINKMPYEPNAMVWMSLLGTSRTHFDVERGKHAAEHAFELDPDDSSPYVLLSNIYAAVGRWDDATKLRTMMSDRGLKKQPGYSCIEVNNSVHGFFCGR